MKLFHRLTFLLVGLAVISSCSKDDFDREPVLNITEKTLTFTKDAGQKSVAVEINDGDKLFFTGVSEWMTVTTTATGFDVSVLENSTLTERQTTISVVLRKGNLAEEIAVTQAPGGKVYIDVSEELFKFSNKEGEASFFVNTNVEWTLSVDGEFDWLTINESEKDKGVISLAVTENTEIPKRVAVLKLSGSGQETIVTVNQKGIVHYDLPFIQIGYIFEGTESERGLMYPNSFPDLYKFEIARGSILTRAMGPMRRFTTLSPVFSTVTYLLNNMGGPVLPSMKIVVIQCSVDPFALLESDPTFPEYLAEEGYELAWRDDAITTATYWNKENQVAIQILGTSVPAGNPSRGITVAYAKGKPNHPDHQTDLYDTYDAVPAFYAEWGATGEQIRAWEEARGSKFLPADSNTDIMLAFAPDPTKEPDIVERVYNMNKDVMPKTLKSTFMLLNHTEKALYPTGSQIEYDGYVPTNEFKSLMLVDGFSYIRHVPYSPIWEFANSDKGLLCLMSVKFFPNEGLIPRLVMEISPL